jgi:hypothetical protein
VLCPPSITDLCLPSITDKVKLVTTLYAIALLTASALPRHRHENSVTHWHEIDQGNMAIPGIENRLQHHGAVVISAADTWHRVGGADLPSSMFGVPSKAAKHALLSKRGQHSQSMEPLRPTTAAVVQSLIGA